MRKRVFIAATRQNDGKTTVSLGLFDALRKHDPTIQYMKPVGQQYMMVDNKKIDKDAVLFQRTFNLNSAHLPIMSPVASPKGFTAEYIDNPNRDQLMTAIQTADTVLSNKSNSILYEGTGHAGVGSVFDCSNAAVAKALGASVIIVSLGGIGKAIDEIMLNVGVFQQMNVPVLGVIINKVLPEKYDKVNRLVRKGLQRLGLDVLGVLPLNDRLTYPTVIAVIDELKPDTSFINDVNQHNVIENFMIGDMTPHNALGNIQKNTLMIVPGNREGLVLTALCENLLTQGPHHVSGIVFTNGIHPHKKILELLHAAKIPLLMLNEDAFSVATKINRMIVKIRSEDTTKIDIARDLINRHIDVDYIYNKAMI